jgi:hypothetical protein
MPNQSWSRHCAPISFSAAAFRARHDDAVGDYGRGTIELKAVHTKEPRNAGLSTQTLPSHSDANQLGGNRQVSWGAPEVWGDLGESTRIDEPEPIVRPSLSKIAHKAGFLRGDVRGRAVCGRGVLSGSEIVNSLTRESGGDLNSTPARRVVSIRRTWRQMLRSRRTPPADRPPAPLDRRERSYDTQDIGSHSSRNSHVN